MAWLIVSLALLCCLFAKTFIDWSQLALSEDLHSHILLIPLVSLYLLRTSRAELSREFELSIGYAVVLLGICVGGWIATLLWSPVWNLVDLLALRVLLFLCGVWGLTFLFYGKHWVRSAAFPLFFLVFMIPLPSPAEVALEHGLMSASAIVSEWVFDLGGVPVHRQGQVLELPGTTLEVAQECSGIRSTLVLLITSILAAHLFLGSKWTRTTLVAAVIPLGILRNAVRIYVIGWLCVERGPEMIDSWIHHKGGPVFFVASLVPLLLLAALLRKLESAKVGEERMKL